MLFVPRMLLMLPRVSMSSARPHQRAAVHGLCLLCVCVYRVWDHIHRCYATHILPPGVSYTCRLRGICNRNRCALEVGRRALRVHRVPLTGTGHSPLEVGRHGLCEAAGTGILRGHVRLGRERHRSSGSLRHLPDRDGAVGLHCVGR
jgi:hypothetical protein